MSTSLPTEHPKRDLPGGRPQSCQCARRLGRPRHRSKVTLLFAGIAVLASSALAGRAHADEPEREVTHDPNAFPTPDTRLPTVAVGLSMTAVAYGGALGGSYLYPTARGSDELRVPIAGPWMSIAETGCPATTPDCSTFWKVVGVVLKGFSGIVQAGGVLVVAEGLFMPTLAPKETSLLRAPKSLATPKVQSSWGVTPTVLPGGAGLGVVGLF